MVIEARTTGQRIRNGALVWSTLFVPIGAWAVHLVATSAFVRYTCNDSGTEWIHHAFTAGTALVCLVCAWLSVRLLRAAGDADEAVGSHAGRTRFLGQLGLASSVSNLALILLEGSYVFFISPCV